MTPSRPGEDGRIGKTPAGHAQLCSWSANVSSLPCSYPCETSEKTKVKWKRFWFKEILVFPMNAEKDMRIRTAARVPNAGLSGLLLVLPGTSTAYLPVEWVTNQHS